MNEQTPKHTGYTSLPRHSRFHDETLKLLSRSFAELPEMDKVGDFAFRESAFEILEAKKSKRIQTFPGSWGYGARFIFRQTRVYLAVCKAAKLEDLMRFTDALTLLLWPFKERGSLLVVDKGFNYSLADAELDLEHWRAERPDIIELLEGIISRLQELEIIQTPAQRAERRHERNVHSATRTRTVAGKVESVLVRHSELVQLQIEEQSFMNDQKQAEFIRVVRGDIAALDQQIDKLTGIVSRWLDKATPVSQVAP